MGKVIHWYLCKTLKLDHNTKWYMHKRESVLENETYKILGNFEIQMDHLFSVWRPDLAFKEKKKKRICHLVDVVPIDFRMEIKESTKILDPCLRTEKTLEHEGQDNTSCSWCSWNSL